jgi:aryl-alcohol dehydrogenase-like predicted oxidoreductase
MEKVQPHYSGLELSPLVVGCWSFGGQEASYWGLQEQKDINAVVREALETGVTCFDTAVGYNDGQSEAALGEALKGLRAKALIINKIPVRSAEELPKLEKTITESLKRLNTDFIDIMMFHWPVRDADLLGANLEALERIREKGLLRRIGTSNFGTGALSLAKTLGIQVALNQAAYNLMTRAIEFSILPYCRENGVGVAAYMPLMQGILSCKFASLAEIPAARKRSYHFNSEGNSLSRHGGKGVEPEMESLLAELRKLSAETGIEAERLAIGWLRAKAGITAVIAGCRSVEQLRSNIKAVRTALPGELVARLDTASAALRDKLGDNADLWESKARSRVW